MPPSRGYFGKRKCHKNGQDSPQKCSAGADYPGSPDGSALTDNPKAKIGRTKPGLSCVPMPALFDVGAVLQCGADKYGPFNWRETPVAGSVYFNAALRHLAQWFEGEDIDPESGRSHLAHVAAGMLIVLDAAMHGKLVDDRPQGTPDGWLTKPAG
jgi:hypothetical protein